MTVYSDIVADIYTITKRPDLVTATAIAIRKATLKLHLAESWARDLVEQAVTPVLIAGTSYSIDITVSPIVRFRGVNLLRDANRSPGVYARIEPDKLFDIYGSTLTDTYYLTGNTLVVNSYVSTSDMLLSYYQLPDTAELTYSSWIATAYPDSVVNEACSIVFKSIGKDQEAKDYAAMFPENLHYLQMLSITP